VVTYTHGYAVVPPSLINEVAGMVALTIATGVGIVSESVGGYRVNYARSSSGAMVLPDSTKSVLNSIYRKRTASVPIGVPR